MFINFTLFQSVHQLKDKGVEPLDPVFMTRLKAAYANTNKQLIESSAMTLAYLADSLLSKSKDPERKALIDSREPIAEHLKSYFKTYNIQTVCITKLLNLTKQYKAA